MQTEGGHRSFGTFPISHLVLVVGVEGVGDGVSVPGVSARLVHMGCKAPSRSPICASGGKCEDLAWIEPASGC